MAISQQPGNEIVYFHISSSGRVSRKITAKTHPNTLRPTTNHRNRLELIREARANPIGLPQSHVPLNRRFHHVFLRPTNLTDMRSARKQLISTIVQKKTTKPIA
jgi:hypothetical protein